MSLEASSAGGNKVPSCFIVVHAGAGYHSPACAKIYTDVCKKACEIAMSFLKQGYDAARAVALAISILEESPYTNAGIGSCLNFNGEVECDASIMDKHGFGAVGSVPRFRNPILIALTLLDTQKRGKLSLGRIPPCVLFGKGALQWAANFKLPSCSEEEMRTEHGMLSYEKYKRMLIEFDAKKRGVSLKRCRKLAMNEYSGDRSSCSSSSSENEAADLKSRRRKYKEECLANRQFFRRQTSNESNAVKCCEASTHSPPAADPDNSSSTRPRRDHRRRTHSSTSTSTHSSSSSNVSGSSLSQKSDDMTSSCDNNKSSRRNSVVVNGGNQRSVAENSTSYETEIIEAHVSLKRKHHRLRVERKSRKKRRRRMNAAAKRKKLAAKSIRKGCCCNSRPPSIKNPVSARSEIRTSSSRSRSLPHTLSSERNITEEVEDTRDTASAEDEQPKNERDILDTLDTVGAIALDCNGELASGVSSGGLLLKYPGRVGQAAMYGCGCWTSRTAPEIAVSTSGCGEHIIKSMFAQRFASDMAYCAMTPDNIKRVIYTDFINSPYLETEDEKLIGLVAMRKHSTGNALKVEVASAHTAQSFCFGFMHPSQEHAEATILYQSPEKRGRDVFSTCFGFEFENS